MAGNIVVIIATLAVAAAQDYFDDRYKYVVDTSHSNIPTHFEASGPDALYTITKYVNDIEKTAERTNSIPTFNVQVTMDRTHRTKHGHIKPTKTKKFKVPLKKKNLRMSSFEIDLRKHGLDNNEKKIAELENAFSNTTTETMILQVTRKNKVAKYKPYLSGVKSKYRKHVKPVANKEIVLK